MAQFIKGGQTAWFHDEGHPAGFFHTYDGLQLGNESPRKVHIFVPRDYESSPEAYPVIYMNDGQTAFFPGGAADQSWQMGETLSDLYQSQAIRKVIVVAIHPLNRDREYTHAPVWKRECCGVEDYARYVANQIKPFVDANYRTLPEPENTLILGSSHGGLAAFYIGTHYPNQFGNIAAFSPSFWVGVDTTRWRLPFFSGLGQSQLVKLASKTLESSQHPKIYLDWGLVRTGGEHNSWIEERATVRGREMRDLLVKRFGYQSGQDLLAVEDAAGEHSEKSWEKRLPQALKFFLG